MEVNLAERRLVSAGFTYRSLSATLTTSGASALGGKPVHHLAGLVLWLDVPIACVETSRRKEPSDDGLAATKTSGCNEVKQR